MSFEKHESCPNCGSRDNLARYTDGHAWCFGCGYFESPKLEVRIQKTFPTITNDSFNWPMSESGGTHLAIPDDTTAYLPTRVLTWIKKYGITGAECKDNLFGWSEAAQMLVMPVYSGSSWFDSTTRGRLLMWQGRYFGPNEKHPKYLTRGRAEDVLHLLDFVQTDALVLTEDLISAIKVGRQFSTVPLFGSNLSLERIVRLSKITKRLVIWLDDDKYEEALKFRNRAAQYIPNVHVLRTPKDPKEYNDEAIYMYVCNAIMK